MISLARPVARVSAVALWMVALSCSPSGQRVDPAKAQRIYDYFRLRPPFQIVALDHYANGGALRFTIKGALGKKQRIYWDGAMRPITVSDLRRSALDAREDSSAISLPIDTVPRLLKKIVDIKRSTGPVIPLRSDEELAAIELLELAAANQIPAARLDSLWSALVADPTVDHLHRVNSLFDEKEQGAFNAHSIAQGLRTQRKVGRWIILNAP